MSHAAQPTGGKLVSVVIPAFNAAETIDETLCSVRAQTYTDLEIVVVDDGSTDATPDIVSRHAAADRRVRLIQQANGGLARARNRGIREASADLIAPVDADDLWAPEKIARQVQALRNKGDTVGLVYTWYAVIDERSHVVRSTHRPVDEGDVLRRMCMGNLVGNGSSALMCKSVIVEAGGYDASLKDRNAQGCEDLLLYFRISERRSFAVVPEALTGYRQARHSMSSDTVTMLRSWHIVAEEMLARHPEFRPEIQRGEFFMMQWLLDRALFSRRIPAVLALLGRMARRHPGETLLVLANQLTKQRQAAAGHESQHFLARPRHTDSIQGQPSIDTKP